MASYLVIGWQLRRRLRGQHVDLEAMDVLDSNAQDVRFLQATRHGEVMTPVELVEGHATQLQGYLQPVIDRLRHGESLGLALVHADVPVETRRLLLGALDERAPLFLASFAGFVAALPGIAGIPKMRALALREAMQEYGEYYFLFPLFLAITLLTTAGFFDAMQQLVVDGIAVLGQSHVAFAQFLGSTVLSAILDNNIVADFASRGLSRPSTHRCPT